MWGCYCKRISANPKTGRLAGTGRGVRGRNVSPSGGLQRAELPAEAGLRIPGARTPRSTRPRFVPAPAASGRLSPSHPPRPGPREAILGGDRARDHCRHARPGLAGGSPDHVRRCLQTRGAVPARGPLKGAPRAGSADRRGPAAPPSWSLPRPASRSGSRRSPASRGLRSPVRGGSRSAAARPEARWRRWAARG